MRVTVKDDSDEQHHYGPGHEVELTGSGQLIVRGPDADVENDGDHYNPGEWAWYRVEDPEVQDG